VKLTKILLVFIYILFLMLPIYWLLNMRYNGYINSISYVLMNTVISVSFALPAAYAFSRYRFMGDKHLFFWLLSNRMAPPAVFVLPFVELYSAMSLFDTTLAVALAHCLFNIPLAVWILEGFMSGVPREVDETAYIDGYSFPHFFVKIFMPLIAAGIGVTAFFCFMFSWVEMLLAKNLGLARRCRCAHHCAWCGGCLVCSQVHSQRLCIGPGMIGSGMISAAGRIARATMMTGKQP